MHDVVVADLAVVIRDLDGLIVAGATARDLAVGRVARRSARIAGDNVQNAIDLLEIALHAPEAAASDNGGSFGRLCPAAFGDKAEHNGNGQQDRFRLFQGISHRTPPVRFSCDHGQRRAVGQFTAP